MSCQLFFIFRLIVSVIFQAGMFNIYWIQLLKCEDLVLFFVINGSNWTAVWTREATLRWALGNYDEHFSQYFLTSYRLNDDSLNRENNLQINQ